MKSNLMKFKNYYGSVHYSDDGRVFYGKLEGIRDLVSFEGRDVSYLRKSFEEAVDNYLETCKEQGREPEQRKDWERSLEEKYNAQKNQGRFARPCS